jgi:Xaa-Pro aminopeptidase
MISISPSEKTGAGFQPGQLLESREKARKVLQLIRERIRVGMTEEQATEIAKAALKEVGSEREWHRPYVRFGLNTVKTFGEPSIPGVRLGEDDLFFIDIGPVFNGYEGDLGQTFATLEGTDFARCAADAEAIFAATKAHWSAGGVTGKELYEFAARQAEARGWILNLGSNGHRLSDFPHAAYYRGGLNEIDFAPNPYAWVLEIQIRHPSREFGAFYEDLLI